MVPTFAVDDGFRSVPTLNCRGSAGLAAAGASPLHQLKRTRIYTMTVPADILADRYSGLARLVERLHRRLLDVVKVELGVLEISNISPVQALLLTAIDGEVSVRDLTRRAYHLGSSISYNLKKLTEHGYVSQAPSPHDKRSVHVSLTEKGVELGERLRARDLLLAQRIFEGEQGASDLQVALGVLRQLDQRWYEHVEAGGAV